jgi:ribosome-associated translation inhibitor RaiA
MTVATTHRSTSHYRRLDVEIETQGCNIPDDERTRIHDNLESLAEELLEFPESHLRLSIVYHPGREEYHVQAWLTLPGKRIVSGRYSPWLDYSLLRCFAKVRRHVERYKENPDSGAVEATRQRLAAQNHVVPATEHVVDAIGKAVQRRDYRGFRRAISGYENWLYAHVANWIRRYPQAERMLGDKFDVDDVVEEVLLTAFEHFPERPVERTISEWLHDFVDPAVQAVWRDPAEREAASYARSYSTSDR